jgi:lysophospholipase L1-like esterase
VPARPKVAVVGDSLAFEAADEVEGDLVGLDVDVRATPGVDAEDLSYELKDIPLDELAAIGVSVGTNDAFEGLTAAEEDELRAVASTLSRVPCVRWMTVAEGVGSEQRQAGARGVNELLGEIAEHHPGIEVVPWHLELADHPEWVAPDGVHHTEAGAAAYAARLSDALWDCVIAAATPD